MESDWFSQFVVSGHAVILFGIFSCFLGDLLLLLSYFPLMIPCPPTRRRTTAHYDALRGATRALLGRYSGATRALLGRYSDATQTLLERYADAMPLSGRPARLAVPLFAPPGHFRPFQATHCPSWTLFSRFSELFAKVMAETFISVCCCVFLPINLLVRSTLTAVSDSSVHS